MSRHDRRYRVLVDELGVSIPPEQHAEIIEPGHDPLQLHAVDQKDRQRRLTLADVIEEGVLQILCAFGCHCRSSIFIRGPLSASRFFSGCLSREQAVAGTRTWQWPLDGTPGCRASPV